MCGLSLSEIRISLNDRNKLSTFTTVVTKVEYPKFLILHFDLENNNLSSVNYDILKKYGYQKKYGATEQNKYLRAQTER